jgi:hypothetical protein
MKLEKNSCSFNRYGSFNVNVSQVEDKNVDIFVVYSYERNEGFLSLIFIETIQILRKYCQMAAGACGNPS